MRKQRTKISVYQAADLLVVNYESQLKRRTWTLVATLAILNGYNPESPPELLLRIADSNQRDLHKSDLAKMRQHLLDDFNTEGLRYSEALQITRTPRQWILWAVENGYGQIPPALVQYPAQKAEHNLAGAPSTPTSKLEARIEWLKQRLREKGIELPLPLHPGGKPGIKVEIRAEALQHTKLFTQATFDHAWKKLPKTDG